MGRRAKLALWSLIAAGSAIRLGLAFGLYGLEFDIRSFVIVNDVLADHGLDLYGVVNAAEPLRWPYPPGYLPAILGADWLSSITGLSFHGWIQVPTIAADACLAWIVQAFLGQRGAGDWRRVSAAALIALGPVFVLISGYHGQIDSLAILPAVAAIVVWERGGADRATTAGLLLGIGASLKIVPALLLLAMLPTARSFREGSVLIAVAIAIPLALLGPFLVADPDGVASLSEYKGAPGMGGITLVLQPELASRWTTGEVPEFNEATDFLFNHGFVLNAAIVAALAGFLFRYRPAALAAAPLVWIAVWTFGSSFFFHYLIWGLPFLVLVGRLGGAAALQLAVLPPALAFYVGPWEADAVVPAYAALMIALWLLLVAWMLRMMYRIASRSAPSPTTPPS